MTRIGLAAVLFLSLLGGCCKHKVAAVVATGHLNVEDCLSLIRRSLDSAPPTPMPCPGEEVTVCYGVNEYDHVKITVAPDPGAKSGDYPFPAPQPLYLTVSANTTIKVESDCDSTTKDVTVINGPTPASFDATQQPGCKQMGYTIDPFFVSSQAMATDVTAQFDSPCPNPVPPFLHGTRTTAPLFGFEIPKPNVKEPFSSPKQAVGGWGYSLAQNCEFRCDAHPPKPFLMTLICLPPPPPPSPPPPG